MAAPLNMPGLWYGSHLQTKPIEPLIQLLPDLTVILPFGDTIKRSPQTPFNTRQAISSALVKEISACWLTCPRHRRQLRLGLGPRRWSTAQKRFAGVFEAGVKSACFEP